MFSSLKKFAKDDIIFSDNQSNFFKAIHRDTDGLYTARISSKPIHEYFKDEVLSLNNEIHIIPFLNHPSIIKYVMFNSKDFENEFRPTLITEYASGGPLSKIIYQETTTINPTQKLIIIYGVAAGMSYLHSHNILHNDLKVENIWVDDRLYPKINGFNVSKKIDPNKIKNKLIIKGTPAYLGPEVYLDKGQSKSSDVYSFSLFVYELLTGKKPFEEFEDIKQFQEKITQYFIHPILDEKITESYRSLIERCWSYQEKDRPTFEEIVNELENNSKFLTEEINKEEYLNYIKFIKESPITFEYNQDLPNLSIYLIKDFNFSMKFKGIYERETNNLSFFLKHLNIRNFKKKRVKVSSNEFGNISLVIDKQTNVTYTNMAYKEVTNTKPYLSTLSDYFYIDNYKCINKIVGFYFLRKQFNFIGEYYRNGSLRNLLDTLHEKKECLTETQKLIIIYGIAYGMSYLHSCNIVHRDLKTECIFLDDYLFPKICEFECSNQSFDGIEFLKNSHTIKQTTYKTMAPEFILNFELYNRTKPIDVYSFAIVLYEIIVCEQPYKDLSFVEIIEKVIKSKRPEFKKTIPNCYKNLIEMCWSQDPNKRPTFDDIVKILEENSQFITKDVDLLKYRKYIKYVKEEGSVSFDLSDRIYIEIKEEESYKLLIKANTIELSRFQKLEKIGEGSFGKVYKVLNKENNEIQACKISIDPLDECSNDLLKSMERELNIISELKFPSVLKFIGYNLNDFKNRSRPTIITEYTPNISLDKILELERTGNSKKEWDDTKKLINIYGIASGMSYIHSHNILHRDLKPGNIFIDKYLFPKIGDFGLSKKIIDETIQISSYQKGTVPYMSPEILKKYQYTKAGDVYAFAFIVYEIMTNNILYKGFYQQQIMYYVVFCGYRPEIPSYVPKCYRKLIENCWNEDPEQRYTFEEIVELLKTCPDFITDTVDQVEFDKYVEFIDENLSPKESNNETQKSFSETFKEISIDMSVLDEPNEDDPTLTKDFIDLSLYEKCELINKNKTWKLYTIKNKQTGQIYSAKITTVKLNKLNRKELINLSREINHLSQIKHPSILKFIGFSATDFSEKRYPVVVTEQSSKGTMSELLKRINTVKEWDDTNKLINIYGIALGMRFLHSHNIIHRDLTPESIFYDDKLYPKIGNFGLSTSIHTQESMTFQSTIGLKGNPVFSSPEVLRINQYSKQSDVYSYGLLVYVIMTNEIPFKNINGLIELSNEVVTKSNRPKFKADINECYRQLIESCWSQNPEDRPTFQDIVYMLETDKRFITSNVNKDRYYEYIKYIDESYIEFTTKKKLIKKDNLIKSKTQMEKMSSESTESDSEESNENARKIVETEEQNENAEKIVEIEEQNDNTNNIEETEE